MEKGPTNAISWFYRCDRVVAIRDPRTKFYGSNFVLCRSFGVTPLSWIYIGIVLCDAGLNNFRFERDSSLALLGRFVLSPIVLIFIDQKQAQVLGSTYRH